MRNDCLEIALYAAEMASQEILKYYKQNNCVKYKVDQSPITNADLAAHHIITKILEKTKVPVVSEEGENLHLQSHQYWLVDPLDGTKDFIHESDEFTINIAFLENHKPILGVIYAPVLNELYVSVQNQTPWMSKQGVRSEFKAQKKSSQLRVATSRFHDHPDVEVFMKENHTNIRVPVGAALKYGRLAFSQIDVFPRVVGSYEWDTAAGQCILESCGGQLLEWQNGETLTYGKATRRNSRFIAFRSPYTLKDFNLRKYES